MELHCAVNLGVDQWFPVGIIMTFSLVVPQSTQKGKS